MDSKKRCEQLKSVRKDLADKLGVDLHQRPCTFEGECKGTCPKCKQEEETLNLALLGKTAIAAGLVVGMITLPGCTPAGNDISGDMTYVEPDPIVEVKGEGEGTDEESVVELSGDIEYIEPETNELDGDLAYEEPEKPEDDDMYVLTGIMPADWEPSGEF